MPDPTATERTARATPSAGRTYTLWTPTDVEAAEALVASGSLQRAADLVWALLGDARVKAAAETRVKGLLRLPLAWEEAGDRRSSGRVARALEGGDWYLAHSEAALCSLAMWGILLGVGIAQRVWTLRNGRWLGVLKPYDARFLRWNRVRRTWVVRTADGDEDIRPGDRRWVLYAPSCSGTPDGDDRPWMYGAWRACARPWLLKYDALSDFGHHSQMHGSAIRTADFDASKAGDPKGASAKAIRDDLNNALSDIGADTSIVPAPGYTVRLVEATAKTWEMFPAQTDLAAREIVIAITGQSSSTEISEGQDTGATLHGIVRQDLIEADAQTLSTCIREQCLVDYAALNFATGELAPWPRWKTEAPVNAKARGESMKSLGEGIASLDAVAPEGRRVNRLAVFEQAGIPLEDAPDPVPLSPATLPDAVAALRDDGWALVLTDGQVSAEIDGEYFHVPLAAAGVTNFPAQGYDRAVSLRNSGYDRVPLGYALALRDDHPDVWAKGGNVLGNRQFARLLPVVRRGGRPETPTEELAVRLREAWCARHAKAGTGATIAGAVAAVKWWTFLNRPDRIRRVIADATSKDTRR